MGLYSGGGGGGSYIQGAYKRNKQKKRLKQADNKTYFISQQDQIRNSNLNCNRDTTKQDHTLISVPLHMVS